ncbi:alkaline phosphatase family protein [Cellulosimicrobium arenosum]|uniref:Alkaline phosphatase family protein n=1 Tax=Cellulosimicrobium arenosum TaxID=2708133 RepID=A0A927IZY2_9MICO|nr:alkaline phosphatase family protein [Cellulosimicrobium arenosum]MBD8079239.1 alkaline phosphatase family protein [Cellulosimicrobium arenosum]
MTQPGPRLRPTHVRARDVRGALWSLVVTAAGLGVAIALVPGVTVRTVWAVVLVAAVVALGDVLLRPLLRVLAGRSGVVGALLSGLGAQVLVAWLALTYLPGVDSDSWTDALAVLVVAALVMAVGRWLVGASDDEYVVGALLRRARRRAHRDASRAPSPAGRARPAGLLVVLLDGVSRPTLDHALQAGLAPTLARWLASGSHHLESWWARVPATTPASTVGLLHGSTEHVPAFRWWSRAQGRLVVTNRPVDAADVEARTSDGRGLLADDGVAVSTMFSGDAATNLLVMSRATSGVGPGQLFVHFFASPFVLVRALLVTAGEWCKELFQGWQQAARAVEPRVSRLGWYPVLRALTNVVLRDLNTTLVAEQLVRGAPVVCVDLVDYDEIAHHAGPLRPESLRALEGLDRVLGLWEQVVAAAPRDYEIVVLSDHGQSLGATFEQVVGRSFLDEVRRLMAVRDPGPTTRGAVRRRAAAPDSEEWGPTNTALHALRHEDSRAGAGRMFVGPDRTERVERGRSPDPRGRTGRPDRPGAGGPPEPTEPPELPEVAVVGSGNLGMVWFPREPARVDGRTVRTRWPGLVPGLLANPAVGVVVVHEDRDGDPGGRSVVAHGPSGRRDLTTGEVVGQDPLAAYGSRAAADLLRVARLEDAGDLVLVSAVDEVGMVHAFEGLVGSHGGLGGAQNEAVLVRPAALAVPDGEREDVDGEPMLVGAEAVHRRLVAWLVDLGVRSGRGADRWTST